MFSCLYINKNNAIYNSATYVHMNIFLKNCILVHLSIGNFEPERGEKKIRAFHANFPTPGVNVNVSTFVFVYYFCERRCHGNANATHHTRLPIRPPVRFPARANLNESAAS